MITYRDQLFASLTLLCFCASTSLQGCSNASGYDSPDNLTPVSGTALIDGEPLNYASLNFIPANGTPGLGGYAVTDGSGAFTAMHMSHQAGLEPGTYEVSFSKMAMPDGSPIPFDKDAADVGAVQSLPEHLTQPNHNIALYMVTVENTPVTANFELTQKAKRRR